ncbi:MAG TPA: lamin tail domain-containing protein, partial [Acidobacteriota bacterium]|nr:lamin tail domain-containing protein [Acidobacteriota bacterium]
MNRTGTSVGIALLQTWPTLTKPIVYLLGLGSVFTRSAIIMLLIVPAFQAQLEAQIVINEIMQNPSAVSDADGEWFEVFNPTGSPIDLNGWAIQDNGSDTHVINNGGLLLIPAGGFLVLGNNGNFATNGGVTIDYVFSGIAVANGADELVLLDGTLNE